MNIRKKAKVFTLALAVFTLSSTIAVMADMSISSTVTGASVVSFNGVNTALAATTRSEDSSIPIYAGAHFSNNSSASRVSSVTYTRADISTSTSGDARSFGYGEHGYLYNGPRVFYSYP